MNFKSYFQLINEGKVDDLVDKIIALSVIFRSKYPFLGQIYKNLKVVKVDSAAVPQNERVADTMYSDQIKTMAVDAGGNIFINADFGLKLPTNEFVGVLVHEVMHVFLGHLHRLGTRNSQLWNIATDLVINYSLVSEGISLPKEGLIPDSNGNFTIGKIVVNVKDKTSEEVYKELEEENKKDKSGKLSEMMDSLDEKRFDDHDYTGVNKEEAEEQNVDVQDIKSESDWKKLSDKAKEAAQGTGTGTGSLVRAIDRAHKSQVDWRKALREFANKVVQKPSSFPTYSKLIKKSYGIGVPLPSKRIVTQPKVELIATVDVSGSISQTDLNMFYAELRTIAKTFKISVDILYWDVNVTTKETIDSSGKTVGRYDVSTKAQAAGISGGGGTNIASVKRYIEAEKLTPTGIVYFTDGYVEETPQVVKNSKHLFIITPEGSGSKLEKFGKIIQLQK